MNEAIKSEQCGALFRKAPYLVSDTCDGIVSHDIGKFTGDRFKRMVEIVDPGLTRFATLRTLQLNLGNRCNLACAHCHVNASPQGDRIMGIQVMDAVLNFIELYNKDITLDLTGGCPEMHPHFRSFIEHTDHIGLRRVIRTNLVIAMEPAMEWLPEFYRDHALTLMASLPCVTRENVDTQRGPGVFEHSIAVLRRLNDLGYGEDLDLTLVYNPGGASLPGKQAVLEALYREKLMKNFGIRFTRLLTITNVPLGRFQRQLKEKNLLYGYLQTLADEFNPMAAVGMMCRSLISVDWMGTLFNCDFNLASGLPLKDDADCLTTIHDLAALLAQGFSPVFGEHCFACTAGCGSGCFGQTESLWRSAHAADFGKTIPSDPEVRD